MYMKIVSKLLWGALLVSALVSCGYQEDPQFINTSDIKADSPINVSFSEALGQMFIVRYASNCEQLNQVKPGGIIFWGDDVSTESSVRSKNEFIQNCAMGKDMFPLFTSTNHEGGAIHYFDRNSKVINFPSAMRQCNQGATYVKNVSKAQAVELYYTGMNMTLGPVADVLSVNSTVIGDRSYGRTVSKAVPCVLAAVEGYEELGLRSVLKHFPGHGGTSRDTHVGFASDTSSTSEIYATHLRPYIENNEKSGNKSYAVMTSHVFYRSLDREWPSTLSKKILTDLLRDELSFPGLLMTDAMTMGAIVNKWSIVDASLAAFAAGNDMLMIESMSDAIRVYQALQRASESGLSLQIRDINGKRHTISMSATEVKQRVSESAKRVLRLKKYSKLLNYDFVDKWQSTPEPNWALHRQLGTAKGGGFDPTRQ